MQSTLYAACIVLSLAQSERHGMCWRLPGKPQGMPAFGLLVQSALHA